jgi:hypothetical protein
VSDSATCNVCGARVATLVLNGTRPGWTCHGGCPVKPDPTHIANLDVHYYRRRPPMGTWSLRVRWTNKLGQQRQEHIHSSIKDLGTAAGSLGYLLGELIGLPNGS